MKPNDHFSFLSNNQVSQDMSGLTRYYLPIVGKDAVALYLYLVSFWDNGAQQRLFSHILNHLDFGMEVLERSLERLSAIGLLELYQTETEFPSDSIQPCPLRTSLLIMCTVVFWRKRLVRRR